MAEKCWIGGDRRASLIFLHSISSASIMIGIVAICKDESVGEALFPQCCLSSSLTGVVLL